MNAISALDIARLSKLKGVHPGLKTADDLLPRTDVGAGLLPSGLAPLDAWLGGLPAGRVTELLGPASAGKTTLALSALRRALQAPGRTRLAALVDLTRTVAPQGAWTKDLLVVRPRRLELGLRALDVLLASAAFSLVVLEAPPSLRSVPDALRVRASRLCRESGTALVACGEHALFGSCSALRLQLEPQPSGRVLVHAAKNRQGAAGQALLPWRETAAVSEPAPGSEPAPLRALA